MKKWLYQNKGIFHTEKQKRKQSQENRSNKKTKLDEREYWEIVTQFSHEIDFGLSTISRQFFDCRTRHTQ